MQLNSARFMQQSTLDSNAIATSIHVMQISNPKLTVDSFPVTSTQSEPQYFPEIRSKRIHFPT